MSALGKMTRIIDIAAHTPAMKRLDLGRRRRIGPVLTKGFSSGKLDHSNAWKNVRQTSGISEQLDAGNADVSSAQRARLAWFFA